MDRTLPLSALAGSTMPIPDGLRGFGRRRGSERSAEAEQQEARTRHHVPEQSAQSLPDAEATYI